VHVGLLRPKIKRKDSESHSDKKGNYAGKCVIVQGGGHMEGNLVSLYRTLAVLVGGEATQAPPSNKETCDKKKKNRAQSILGPKDLKNGDLTKKEGPTSRGKPTFCPS